ncbi:MAG TPA: hypothetical protein VJ652_12650 [Noviherbaspirillum sp.]|nr:hypothetical protein [Noviherbaspirillum sp.]
MSDKSAAFGSIRQPSAPTGAWRTGIGNSTGLPTRRLTRQQRTEQERLDRYGRFGRR